MKHIHVYALFLISVFLTSCGQNQTGLPKNNSNTEIKDIGPNIMVRNIKKGKNGTILIAGPNNSSFGDVFRYDARLPEGQGKSFTNLTSKIGSHRFWDVLEDRRGNIWFTSTDSGVYYYNTSAPLSAGSKSIQHFTTREGLADNRVMSVYEDKAGIIWFGTGAGISRYDPNMQNRTGKSLPTGQAGFRNFKNPNAPLFYKEGHWNNDITTIIEDKTGKLWVGTRGDAFVYDARLPDGQGKKFTTLTHNGEPFLDVWSIMEDRKGNIWLSGFNGFEVSQTGGLWRYDGSTFTKVSERGAYAIIEDKKGNIWTTGSVNPANPSIQAVSRYDAKSLYSKKPIVTEIMSGKAFFGLLEANDGSIWFGDATGVYRYDARLPDGQGKTITDFYNKEGQKKYIIDTKQSAVIWKSSALLGGWEGSKFLGDGSNTGDVDILKGEFLIENRHLVGGTVKVDMNTIENFVDQRSLNQLPPFFDVKKFPVSTFAITKVVTGDRGNIKVTGNLTIEGITKAVTFPAKMEFKDGMDGTVVMNGALIIDRTNWGIDYTSEKYFDKTGDGTISDDVKFFMKIVAKKINR
jgi:polyisoprenoid-binding protein YceI